MLNDFFLFLKEKDVEYKRNINGADCSFVKIGGDIQVVVFPDTAEKIIATVKFLNERGIPYRVLGAMSNVLLPDGAIEFVVISTSALNKYSREGCEIIVESGVVFSALIVRMAAVGLGGFEALFGIPGTMGGMVAMNAGAYGATISDFLTEATVYNVDSDRVQKFKRDELDFSYRSSLLLKQNLILLSAKITGKSCEYQEVIKRINEVNAKRRSTQPIGEASLGSVFKRPEESISAAYYIDKCGLKGFRVGGAEISPKHAGFIINRTNASSEDYKQLISIIKERVFSKFGVRLMEEIIIL